MDEPSRQDETPRQPTDLPFLARDTLADKSMRFGCGASLALLIVASVALYVDVLALGGLIVFGAVLVGVCGVLGVRYGDRFIVGLLKVMNWL